MNRTCETSLTQLSTTYVVQEKQFSYELSKEERMGIFSGHTKISSNAILTDFAEAVFIF